MAAKVDIRLTQLSVSQKSEEIRKDPVNELSSELVLKIFSYLNLSSLKGCLLVNRQWNQLANDPLTWKTPIYKELAFSIDKWAQCLDEHVVAEEDRAEEFLSLPLDIAEEYRRFQRAFPNQNARDSLMLVRLPKTLNGGLTIRSIGELAKRYFPRNPTGYGSIFQSIFDELGDRSIDRSCWVIMIKGNDADVLEGSRSRTCTEQVQIIASLAERGLSDYKVPDALAVITCIFAKYFSSRVRLLGDSPWTYTWCQDNVQDHQVLVGGFVSGGLDVIEFASWGSSFQFGVTALRKF